MTRMGPRLRGDDAPLRSTSVDTPGARSYNRAPLIGWRPLAARLPVVHFFYQAACLGGLVFL